MSFLTQLRQQSTQTQSLQLCYVLDINHSHHTVLLKLTLLEFHQGRAINKTVSTSTSSDIGKPYHLQRQHLQSPPPFIIQEDIACLHYLVEEDASWLDSCQGEIPIKKSAWFLHYLLNCKRFFININGKLQQLTQGNDQPICPHWTIDSTGYQHFCWKKPHFCELFFLSRPHLLDTNNFTIAEGRCSIESAILQKIKDQKDPLSKDTVTTFLLKYQQQWLQWQLPLPKELPIKNIKNGILTPVIRLYSPYSANKQLNILQLEFRYQTKHYCGTIIPANKQNEINYWNGNSLVTIQRHIDKEKKLLHQLSSFLKDFNFDEKSLSWNSNNSISWQKFFTQHYNSLQSLGFTRIIQNGFRHHYIIPENWQVQLQANDNKTWQLDIQLQSGDQRIDLLSLLTQLQNLDINSNNSQYCLSMDDGRFILLPKDNVSGLMEELGDLAGNFEGPFQLPHNQLNRLAPLQALLPENTEWLDDDTLLEQSISIHSEPQLPHTLSNKGFDSLNATLRPYQQLGTFWMQHLKQHQINGLLADDMGLGKTLQTLAHLCLEKQLGQLQLPALIVVPTSLLHNWSSEIEHFAPDLNFIILHGPQRHQHWDNLTSYDLIITSYSLISKDLDQWQKFDLSWVILDEAQIIKNRNTQISTAIRCINSRHRLCLSGTPVENHLGELWSIFDFLMPGCLGSYSQFKDYFKNPIEKNANGQRFEQLLQRIAPFMLRRTKEQVASDLPPKTEIYQPIIMDNDQRDFYDTLRSKTCLHLEEQLKQDFQTNAEASLNNNIPSNDQFDPPSTNSGNPHLQVLTALLKLRQACCDPQLLNEVGISSAKKDHCLEMIRELVAENRSILLFSQFTSMLDIIAESLDKMGIDYLTLTGASQNRQALVKDFQAGKAPVFLISLKAGGVGLNLTRADTVIHYDPWWNNAAEQQASDRAHRIGQKKPVFVYKLIIENSIEEKIAQLQQRKSILSQDISAQAQLSGEQFAFKLQDILNLIKT